MRRHPSNGLLRRRVGTSPGRRRRAFTIIEVVGAMAIFTATVGALTGASLTALNARSILQRSESIDRALASILDRAATTPFSALAADTGWDVPDLCPGSSTGAGTREPSCPPIDGRVYRVALTRTFSADAAGGDGRATDSGDAITLTATTTRIDGSTVTRARSVAAPTLGWRAGTGLVRVTTTGDYGLLDTPLLLVAESAPDTIVAAGRVDAEGTALLRVPAGSCTAANWCRVALNTGAGRGYTPTFTLDAATVVGLRGRVVAVTDQVVDASAHLYRRGTADIAVTALDPTSNRRTMLGDAVFASGGSRASVAGSVCIWASFNDGMAGQAIPLCNNSADANSIRVDLYTPDAAQPTIQLPVPSSTTLTLTVDRPSSATCPIISGQNQRYWAGAVGSWTPVSTVGVCTSWTWGKPSAFRGLDDGAGQTTAPFTMAIAKAEHSQWELLWSGIDGRPAGGYGNEPVWAKPRDGGHCPGMPTSCTPPATGSPPEATACPGLHCQSSALAAPAVIDVRTGAGFAQVRRWPFTAAIAASATADFQTTIVDPQAGPTTIQVLTPPGVGTLQGCPAAACAAGTGPWTVANGAPFQWRYTAPAIPPGGTSFAVSLTGTGGIRNEQIGLPVADGGWSSSPMVVRVGQGETADLASRVFDTTGAPSVGTTVRWSDPPTGATFTSASAVTDARGVASTGLLVTSTPAGPYAVTVIVGARSFTQDVVVTSRLRSLTADSSDGAQGATATYTLSARDGADDAAAGWPVSVAAEMGGAPATGAYAAPAACVTNASGQCSGTITVSPGAATGDWEVVARSNGASGTHTATITAAAGRATGSLQVAQGGSGDLAVTLYDGAGSLLADAPVSLAGGGGLNFSAAGGSTDGAGVFHTTVSAGPTTTAGPRTVHVTSGATLFDITVTVTARPASITAASPYTVPATGVATAVGAIRVLDGTGFPIPYGTITAGLDIPGTSSERVSSQVTADASGVATIWVSVPTGTSSGGYTVRVSSADEPAVSLDITVNVP